MALVGLLLGHFHESVRAVVDVGTTVVLQSLDVLARTFARAPECSGASRNPSFEHLVESLCRLAVHPVLGALHPLPLLVETSATETYSQLVPLLLLLLLRSQSILPILRLLGFPCPLGTNQLLPLLWTPRQNPQTAALLVFEAWAKSRRALLLPLGASPILIWSASHVSSSEAR